MRVTDAEAREAATALLERTIEAMAAQDHHRVLELVTSVLRMPPLGREQRDAAGMAAADLICDELDRQANSLWSDLAGPLSLDPLVDRFLPVVQAADGLHRSDLRWALEYLADFRLSARAKARVDRELRSTPKVGPPLTGAVDVDARAERVILMLGSLMRLIGADPALSDPGDDADPGRSARAAD